MVNSKRAKLKTNSTKFLNKKMVCMAVRETREKSLARSSRVDAKENNRETSSAHDATVAQDNAIEANNLVNMGSQKFRRRDYQHHHHLGPPRSNTSGGQQDKRNKHDPRRKRRHSGDERDDRNRKQHKVRMDSVHEDDRCHGLLFSSSDRSFAAHPFPTSPKRAKTTT